MADSLASPKRTPAYPLLRGRYARSGSHLGLWQMVAVSSSSDGAAVRYSDVQLLLERAERYEPRSTMNEQGEQSKRIAKLSFDRIHRTSWPTYLSGQKL